MIFKVNKYYITLMLMKKSQIINAIINNIVLTFEYAGIRSPFIIIIFVFCISLSTLEINFFTKHTWFICKYILFYFV